MPARSAATAERARWGWISSLGVATIVAYGVAYYSYSALIDPIRRSTGWSATALGATFSAALVIGGVGGLFGGRLTDRFGTRPAFLIAGALGAGGIALASLCRTPLAFGSLYGVGAGAISAVGYYHVTQPAAIRAGGSEPQRAVVVLTIFGAFASPIFLPLTALLAETVGWRDTLRIHAMLIAIVFLIGASRRDLENPCRNQRQAPAGGTQEMRAALLTAWQSPAVRRWVLASMISGAAIDVILVYQVPIMIAAGLPTGAAATIAGLRGFAQVGGRLTLPPLLTRVGARLTTVAALVTAVAAALLLLGSRDIILAGAYCLLAGVSLGAISTLQGIYTNELVGGRDLSMLMGAQQAVFALGSALGPVIAALLFEQAHSYTPVIMLTAVGLSAAALLLGSKPRRQCGPVSTQAIPDSTRSAPRRTGVGACRHAVPEREHIH
jgi:MFS family permease